MAWLRIEDVRIPPGTILLTAITCLLVYLFVLNSKKKQKLKLIDQIPGPDPISIFEYSKLISGELNILFQFLSGISYICSLTSSIYRIRVGSKVEYALVKASAVETLLGSNKLLDKGSNYQFLHPWLGLGLLTSSGEKWHSRRKILTPAFHFKILEDFVDVFNKQCDILTTRLLAKADGNTFDIYPFIAHCALDIICESAMGCSVNAQGDSDSEYVKAVGSLSNLIRERMAKPWQKPKFLFRLLGYDQKQTQYLQIVHGFTKTTIRERREILDVKKETVNNTLQEIDEEEELLGKKKRMAFLDLLLEQSEGQKLCDQDIQDEVDTFMFEGHDTTAAAMNWFIYLMGSNVQVQEKVHEELDRVFGDSERPVTMADLRELNYLERCIKETLRLFPSVPAIGRYIKEDVIIDNYKIPAGSSVHVMTYRLHRDPDQFPNPEVFDPDRFLPEQCRKRHPYAYVPFSAGPRNCIGQKFALMEEKVVLSSILRRFRVESITRRENLKVVMDLVLRPLNANNLVKLFPRERY